MSRSVADDAFEELSDQYDEDDHEALWVLLRRLDMAKSRDWEKTEELTRQHLEERFGVEDPEGAARRARNRGGEKRFPAGR